MTQHSTTSRSWLILLLGGLWLLCATGLQAGSHAESPPAYRFGIFPYLSPTRIEQAYAPLAAAFAELLGHPLRLGTAKDLDTFRARLLRGDFDIALVPPFAVVPLVDRRGYTPLARRPSNPARIVVLINSPLKHVGDLRDQTLGLPPARSLVNVIIRVDLDERGLWAGRDFQARHFPSTPACLHNLLVNRVDACATGGGAGLRSFERKMGVKLRTLYQTQPFPHMLFITRPDFPADEANKLKQFILGLGESAEGRELLRQIGPDSRFVPYRPADYDVIRRYHKTMQRHAQILP
ncbi:MAG TPA: phosphate/phosphite/phosphonate ABC transporter substrate-binding protein [Chromatiales bacterium]|nr:phosphate/phosphite/phosphonate ABC transporter substrate-binding protein [Chromatiales bacterium]HEX21830.1 phosphate/phosphite/phosphonate ABC transporter substrate-binding protein [Chromatiales bacterium]